MKKIILTLSLSVLSLITFAQSSITTELVSEERIFEGSEYLWMKEPLNLSNGDNEGIILFPHFKKLSGVWVCVALGVKNYPDEENLCFGYDVITIIFEDETREEFSSWRSFYCSMEYDFDLEVDMRKKLSKPIKGIQFVNGRSLYTFQKLFTSSDEKNYFINVFKNLDKLNVNNLTK